MATRRRCSDDRKGYFFPAEPPGDTASTTFSTCSLISCTFGWTSRIKSCSARETFSMRIVISCSSFNIASWREEIRCIHQKQTHQQPSPNPCEREEDHVTEREKLRSRC